MNLNFDKHGFLKPYKVISCDLETLESYFVDAFPNSHTRRPLFNNYLRYIHDFRNRVTRYFTQWLNGSFISQKQNPNDIDFVTFFDYKIYEIQEPYLDKFWTFSLEDKGLDAYLVQTYPENHQEFEEMQKQQENWFEIYGTTKVNENRQIFRKGFIELKFD